jgi:putative membrane protein
LFYLVINALIILLCDKLVDGFMVDTFWTALLFSIILSLSQSLVYKLTESK